MLFDSHVNLHHEAFAHDRAEVIARAREAGIGVMITICDRIENFEQVSAIAATHEGVYASCGAHPHYAKDHQDLTPEKLIALAQYPKVVGIGETGLDLHYGYSALNEQLRVFHAHAEAARATGLPLIVHTREADQQTHAVLREHAEQGPLKILLHCYTSGMALAQKAFELGAYISFSGIMTFKNADDVRAVARIAPLDRIIIETDCPYLTPVPFRGRRCEPAHVALVEAKLAEVRGMSVEELRPILADNFFALFGEIERPRP